ncbi:hypothetical protein [Paenibacillus macerans]|uniref:Bacterial PH domain protein n=1 Tax=Paenibacillus macerans TaxID=44252 RepID=A0A091A1Z0_PAEMA|nr:hypothetical protein [Paenibacillus macerans]KFN10341.1 hypothetical protein DJ90_825 [Paenibacillus macerans]MCY7556859.1 hypothetical protein [Paenibacillus macerans]MEC0150090.1 hypothetical protein [Paenibacillus macerans]SUD26241.1 Uncharacterised protein [Paenibacillus macerans]
MRGFFVRLVVRNLLGETFRPAVRDTSGGMILKKSRFVFVSCLLGLLVTSAGLAFLLLDESPEMKEFMPIAWLIGFAAVLLLFHVLNHLVFRAEAGENSIKVRSLGGTRTLRYEELRSVSYSRFNSGQFVLQGAAGTVRIPAGIRGAAEFVALISGKIGEAACTDAIKALDVRREDLRKWGEEA